MTFGEKLAKLRKSNGYTQEGLAELLGVSRQAVARWEAGETAPDITMLSRICEIFRVSADAMIREEEEASPAISSIPKPMPEKKEQQHLISGACAAVANVCAIVSAAYSVHPLQLALSCVCCALFAGLTTFHFYNYLKKK